MDIAKAYGGSLTFEPVTHGFKASVAFPNAEGAARSRTATPKEVAA